MKIEDGKMLVATSGPAGVSFEVVDRVPSRVGGVPTTSEELDARALDKARTLVRIMPETEDPDVVAPDVMYDFFTKDMPRILAMLEPKE